MTALLKPPCSISKKFQGLFAVSLSSTPGQSRLPNAAKEVAQIEKITSNLHHYILSSELATVERVVEGMERHSWVHFACHAGQDTVEPTKSAFHLHDGNLPLSKIITKSFPHADFAFLSACQTARGVENLPEEVVHLTAGMMAVGYKSIIATMWSIKDDDAPFIATEVYSYLIKGPELDSTQAAHALHHAVKCLRKELEKSGNPSFLSWVPFIHVGM